MRRAGILGGLAALLVACAAPDEVEADEAETEAALAAYTPPPAYAEGKEHSDLTAEVVANLRAIRARGQGDARSFIKVGDSITVSTSFLRCLATTPLGGEAARLEETRRFFTPESWARASLAAEVGWHTRDPLRGDPSPLARETAAMRPAFAVIMLGTNDLYDGTEPTYELNLRALVDAVAERGIVPILSTIPPIRNPTQDRVVPKVNLIVRRVAAEARIPLMDLHAKLVGLPRYGLSGDGIHPAASEAGACDFSASALAFGYNQRNVLTLTALDRVRRALDGG